MENLFDGLQDTAFAIVTNTMGYTASWTPSNGAIPGGLTAQVLFKDASETAKLLEVEYDPKRAIIEYKINDFPGLQEAVDSKNDEYVIIKGMTYGINEIKAKYDGKTFFAQLQLT